MSPDNPFAQPSSLPYQLPPFDRILDGDYLPAFTAGMAAQRAEIARIAHQPEPASFDNTLVAMERAGELLERVSNTFFALDSANGSEQLLQIETEVAPLLAAHQDAIHLDPALFARIDSLYAQRARLDLEPESRQLLARYRLQFVRAGALLAEADQQRLRGLNQQLSSLTTQFRQNVLKATREGAIEVDQLSLLDGLSPQQIGAAAAAAAQRGLKQRWLITLQNTTTQPVLEQLRDRSLRQRIYLASIGRCRHGATDNTGIIARIVQLRAERARLLGYPDHAAYMLQDETAGTPQAAGHILRQIGAAALQRARAEAADIQCAIDAQAVAEQRERFELQPWDWQYYSERVRQQQFDFDIEQVRDYFELDRVLRDGVFYVARQLYGVGFKERHDLPLYHPSVRVFEVSDADGSALALFLGDYYARDNKQGGAWMNSLVQQSQLRGLKPVVTNNLNIPQPAAGAPTLLTFDEVTTLFHEFGHALHGIFSNVRYPSLGGTNVPPDFVEFPSQFNEMWAREPQIVAHFARHYRSDAPMPAALLDKVIAAQRFDQGYRSTEYIEAALIDLAWHETPPTAPLSALQVTQFESAALENAGLRFPAVPPRYHSPYFLHIFSGDQYAAGYYAYLWSEVLARDTGAWMQQRGGATRANGEVLRQQVLSRGRTQEPQALFQQFYGGAPDVAPLLQYRGLSLPHAPGRV